MGRIKPICQAILKTSEFYHQLLEDLVYTAVATREIEIGNIKSISDIISELNSEIAKLCDSEGESIENEHVDDKNNLNSEVRQLAILNKIKDISSQGNEGCGIRDLISLFPDVSDRTLRNDLQKLCFQDLIIKVGNRGPNTVYKSVL